MERVEAARENRFLKNSGAAPFALKGRHSSLAKSKAMVKAANGGTSSAFARRESIPEAEDSVILPGS